MTSPKRSYEQDVAEDRVKRLRQTDVKLMVGTEAIDVSWVTVFNSHHLRETVNDARKRNHAEPFAFNPPLGMAPRTLATMLNALDAYYENRFASEKDVKITDYVREAESRLAMLATLHFLQVDSVKVVPELCKAIWEKPGSWGPLDQLHALFADVGFYGQKYLPLMMHEALVQLAVPLQVDPSSWNDEFLERVLQFAADQQILPVHRTVKDTRALCLKQSPERPTYAKWYDLLNKAVPYTWTAETDKLNRKAMKAHVKSLWSFNEISTTPFEVFEAYTPCIQSQGIYVSECRSFTTFPIDFYGIKIILNFLCDKELNTVTLKCSFDYGHAHGWRRWTDVLITTRIHYLEPGDAEVKRSILNFEFHITNQNEFGKQFSKASEISRDEKRTRFYLDRCQTEPRPCVFMTVNYSLKELAEDDDPDADEDEDEDDE